VGSDRLVVRHQRIPLNFVHLISQSDVKPEFEGLIPSPSAPRASGLQRRKLLSGTMKAFWLNGFSLGSVTKAASGQPGQPGLVYVHQSGLHGLAVLSYSPTR
jgi:hypothetical protein